MEKTVLTNWDEAAVFCHDTYGCFVDWKEGYFACPDCGEPIYMDEWEDNVPDHCPICSFDFVENRSFTDWDEEEDEDESYWYDDGEEDWDD